MRRAYFEPVRQSTCSGRLPDTEYGVYYDSDYGQRVAGAYAGSRSRFQGNYSNGVLGSDVDNRRGTVVLGDPSTIAAQLYAQRGAETPETAAGYNPVTGVGKGSMVRVLANPGPTNPTWGDLQRYSYYPPGGPDFMEGVSEDTVDLASVLSNRATPLCGYADLDADVDSDFYSDGYYGSAVLKKRKEGLTSNRPERVDALLGERVGLGSIRLDPRFQPGPPHMLLGGDAAPAPGTYAGGDMMSGRTTSRLGPTPNWDFGYVYAQPRLFHGGPEALRTGQTMWRYSSFD